MKAQQRTYSCGIASIQNALECLGIKRTQGAIRKLCLCTEDGETAEDLEADADAGGTPEEELVRGLLACGARVDVWHAPGRLNSMHWLQQHLWDRGPAIVCVDSDEHYVTAIGILNQTTFVVFDPARGVGLRIYDWHGMATRWAVGRKSGGPSYYGIGVSK